MKKLIFWLMLALGTLLCSDAANAQYLPVTTPSNCITDGSGAAMASGKMIVVGTDANDNPIPYRAGTSTMATTSPITRTITNGALATSLQLADPASTSPLNVLYRFAIQDSATQRITLYKQIVIANNDSGNFNFCKMNPLPFTTQIQFASAPFSFSGDWALLGNLSVVKSTQLCASTVTFSATPTFNAGICNGWKITLTGNVTSSTLSGASFGEPLFFEVCQDATGGRTFVPPTNVSGWTPIPTTASTCSAQQYWYDGTNAVPDLMPGLLGDVTSPAGSTTTTVVKVNGVSYSAGPSTHSVPVVTAANTVTYKVIPDCTDTTGNHLNYTQSSDTFSCGTSVPATVVLTTGSQTVASKNMTSMQINGENVTNAPRMVISGYTTATTNAAGISRFTPDKPITFTSIHYTVIPGGTIGAGCTTAPILRINNGTINGPSITLTNGSGTGDLTGQSVNYPAGTALQIEISTASAGCTTAWTNLNVTAQYKMQ